MSEPYDFSLTTKMVLDRHVNRPVITHPRSTRDAKMGYGFSTVLEEILQKGRADFRVGFSGPNGDLTPKEKCLLYGFYNAKKHYAAARMIFDECRAWLEPLIREGLTMIDIGCGPATAGVAFADCFPRASLDYRGVDIAPEMLTLGTAIMQDLKNHSWLDASSTFEWAFNWRDLPAARRKHTLVMGCYLFASDSLDEQIADLADYLKELSASAAGGTVFLFYANSTNELAGENYVRLGAALGFDGTSVVRTVKYMTSSGVREDTFHADVRKLS